VLEFTDLFFVQNKKEIERAISVGYAASQRSTIKVHHKL